jgi:hypothetical protein
MSTHGGTSTSAPPATTVTGPDAIGAPAVVGTGLHYARNDHDHGLPILDYNALQYNDLLGWSFDPAIAGGSGSGQPPANINLYRIPLPAPITITNLLICTHAVAGVLLTHSYLALFKSNGTIVGQTADQSANFMANTYHLTTAALVGGPHAVSPLAANDFVWAALYIGTAGTMPTFQGDPGCNVMNAGVTAARARSGYIGQADTATLVSITPANINLPGSGNDIWMGIS